jgi:DNA-binding GntR family transcriptional regulator
MSKLSPPQAGRTARDTGTPLTMPARSRVKLVLHRGIVTGTIPGGTRLVQSCIAEELAVGTRPVRDALRELAAEGFVRLDGRGAAVVRELGRGELEDIYEIRMMLEPVATARAARLADAASLIRAGELLSVMQATTDSAQWVEHNASFHKIIDEAGSSPRLVAILGNLRELSARYITHSVRTVPGRASQANAEHVEILRAIIARDPDAAADAAIRHLEGTPSALSMHPVGAARPGLLPATGLNHLKRRVSD